jgi:murein DD-endopeptidase MepM/ murein hydrolase activator NlpD
MPRIRSALLAIALLTGVVAAPSPATAQQPEGPTYVVEEGDTLIGISVRFGADPDELAALNGISDPGSIFPGMQLTIPGFEGVTGVLTTEPVQLGDTLASLALNYGIKQEDLIRLNRLGSAARLYVDMPLIVPVQEGPTPTAATLTEPDPDSTPLANAVDLGINPWLLQGLNRASDRLWAIGDAPLYVPGPAGGRVGGLPESFSGTSIKPLRPKQGDTTVVRVDTTTPGSLSGRLGERDLHFFPDQSPDDWVALQGIHALQPPGLVDLTLDFQAEGDTSPSYRFVQPIRIDEGDYARERIKVPEDTIDPANTGPEDAEVTALLSPASPEKLWTDPFAFPTDYHDTFPSVYGTRRNYNDTGWNAYHTGLDLYGNVGKPIMAAAPGVVVFAGPLTVRGNTTYIDHGWGVYSGYLHQSVIDVKPGDRVEAGQVIGEVGGTGRVTGPHLHWEIWVGGVPVQPLEWAEKQQP